MRDDITAICRAAIGLDPGTVDGRTDRSSGRKSSRRHHKQNLTGILIDEQQRVRHQQQG